MGYEVHAAAFDQLPVQDCVETSDQSVPLWVEAIASICKGVFEATGQMQGLGLHTARWQDGPESLADSG